ncbi:Pentatricopeptide repeat-containing protein [Thalictrum thalictroides]|uniref:Pentatricopeptide repeat-containing protein n=1 Tax=Thalictrum thalictroides TaxID=46969 RepID=A0A7J6W0N2_THATH|nr:Pentatricopeptide repeat-containing protein [Thalictrum thalictroides]
MYLKFGNFDSARYLFEQMPHRDEVSWNTMMSGYVKVGLYSEAIDLFREMWVQGFQPDGFMLTTLVTACDGSGYMLSQGVQIHGFIVKVGFLYNVFVSTALMHFYGTYEFLSNVHRVFEEMLEKNTVSWTCLMVSCSSNSDLEEVVQIYRRMRLEGVNCNQSSFSTVISSCGLLGNELLGHQVLAHVVLSGFESNVSVSNSLISMFGNFGNVKYAKYIFDWMEERDIVSWNSIISVYSHSSLCEESLRCFHRMRHSNVKPNSTTLSILVYACNSVYDLDWGRGIHGLAFKVGFDSISCLCSTLVTLYSEFGRWKDAEFLFQEMPERDMISWNSMMASYVQSGEFENALNLLAELHGMSRITNNVTLAYVLSACSCLEALNEGKIVHALIIRAGLHDDLLVGNALVSMYGNCRMIEKAEHVLGTMPVRDVVTWNALIGGHNENEEPQQAIKVFNLMREDASPADYITMVNLLGCFSGPDELLIFGMPIHAHTIRTGFERDYYVQNSLLTMYARCGDLCSSNMIFEHFDIKNVVSWNAMIAANAHHGRSEEALKLFVDMHRARLDLDNISISESLAACANLALLEEGRQIHNLVIKIGLETDFHVINASMDMYGKCGELEDVLQMLPAPENRSRSSWNILISAFSRQGYCKEASKAFEDMLQVGQKPDHITFISLLSAFNHGGLVDEGLACFTRMASEFQIHPRIEHCACVVDLLGRAGRLIDAENFIKKMPIQPNDLIWRSLLSACRTHNNVELGRKAAEHLLDFDSLDDSAYVLLSNVYALNGRWKDMETIRRKMEIRNVNKSTAQSWVR